MEEKNRKERIIEAGTGVIEKLSEYDLGPMEKLKVLVAVLESAVNSVDVLYNFEMKSGEEIAESFIDILKQMVDDDDE